MQPFRFLLYCLSSVAGFYGLVLGGGPVIASCVGGRFNDVFTDETLFRHAVIFLLALILLILIHVGHRLVGAFSVSLPKKPETSDLAKKSEV